MAEEYGEKPKFEKGFRWQSLNVTLIAFLEAVTEIEIPASEIRAVINRLAELRDREEWQEVFRALDRKRWFSDFHPFQYFNVAITSLSCYLGESAATAHE